MRLTCTPSLNRRIALLLLAGALSPALGAQNRQLELQWLRNAGWTIGSPVAGDQSGTTAVCAGDVNNDGYDDVLIGAPLASPGGVTECGEAWIVYGGPNATGNKSLANADVTLKGNLSFGHAGFAVAAAGDVNDDGFDDVLIGAPGEKPHGTGSGQSYLVYGAASLPATITLAALGSAGVTLNGVAFSDLSGSAVAGLGDANGDTFPDLAIGAPGSTHGGPSFSGESYIVYGGRALPTVVELSALGTGTGCKLRGIVAGDNSGDKLAAAGDVNGDGLADLLVGAHFGDAPGQVNAGQAFLVYGSATLPAIINFATLGAAGVVFNGAISGDQFGSPVAGAGDVNHDGKDDILISAQVAHPAAGVNAGIVYLVFGSASLPATVSAGSLGALGVLFPGPLAGVRLGNALAGGGDVDRDGIDDFAIGDEIAPLGAGGASGIVYLIYGSSGTWPASFDVAQTNERGVQFNGTDPLDNAGQALSFGDVNGDTFDDLVIGAERGDVFATDGGETTIAYGAPHFLQTAGPTAEGDWLFLRGHGAPNQPMEMMFSPFVLANGPLNTGFGPFWLGNPFFEVALGTFASNGEKLVQFKLPPPGSGLVGLSLYMQFLGKPQGQHLDLTALLAFTIQ